MTRSTDTTEQKGTVIEQNPDGGSEAEQGDTVTIVVSDFEEPTETPSETPTETPTETPSETPTETPTALTEPVSGPAGQSAAGRA